VLRLGVKVIELLPKFIRFKEIFPWKFRKTDRIEHAEDEVRRQFSRMSSLIGIVLV
jgi:hypothetical protein